MTSTAPDTSFRMIAKSLFGLEEVLARELTSLGGEKIRLMNRSVEFVGDKYLLYKTNLCCRTATRILVPIDTFDAPDEGRLYRHINNIDWSAFLTTDMTLAIDAVVNHSNLKNSLYVSQLAKDAIVDQFRETTGRRPSVDLADPDLRINLHIHENIATLSLDASNEPLHKRGYRTAKGQAPINEILAAGILALTEWDQASPLVDGMCGSGTFVIEAAMMARNIAPGIKRQEFGFMRWKDYNPTLFEAVRKEARDSIKPTLPFDVLGSDLNPSRIRQAKTNAQHAGVENDIRFECKPYDRQTPPPPPGTLIVNPPYGERLAVADIAALYHMIGDTLKQNYQGYNAFIFTGNLPAAKNVGLRTSKRIPLYNGPIESRLLKYEIYAGSRKTRP